MNALKTDMNVLRLSDADSSVRNFHPEFVKQNLPHVDLELDSPDETWIQLDESKNIVGHFSLWYCETPTLGRKTVGYIGHYYAKTFTVGKNILMRASELLKGYGCQLAVGPVDGNTWRRYRLVSGTADVPKFLLEPENPLEYPAHFIDAEFETLSTYSSSILDVKPQFVDEATMEKLNAGELRRVTIRAIDLNNFDRELRTIYGIACDAFEDNFLYSEISEFEFIQRYHKMKPVVIPQLVLIAEHEKHPIAFALAVPDPTLSNNSVKTAILKTVGRIKDDRFKGLGLKLIAECHAAADKLGFSRMIHALYRDDNISSTYSTASDAQVFRRYAVYGKIL